jgi:hypothetical protein
MTLARTNSSQDYTIGSKTADAGQGEFDGAEPDRPEHYYAGFISFPALAASSPRPCSAQAGGRVFLSRNVGHRG